MVILYHFGEEQFSMILQVFLVLTCSKRWQFCFLISANVHVFLGHKIIYVLHRPYFGTPCITVYQKTGLIWFHCKCIWIPMASQIVEICVCMLVEFVFHGQCSGEPWNQIVRISLPLFSQLIEIFPPHHFAFILITTWISNQRLQPIKIKATLKYIINFL